MQKASDWLNAALQEKGLPALPAHGGAASTDPPDLDPVEAICLEIHAKAATMRPPSMGGIPPLPWVAVRDAVIDAGIDANYRPLIEYLVQYIDSIVIEHIESEANRASKNPGPRKVHR